MKPTTLRLGEILEQRGRLAREQTLRALRNQKVLGGRLGTCLLEIDAVAEDDLLAALSEIHGVPAVAADELRGIPAEVLALVPAKIAQRCQAIPFHASSTQVKVAVANARDLSVQDEISFVVGKRIRWHVATDLRIHEALERAYGVECPTRFAKLLDRLNRSRYLWSKDVATTSAADTMSLPAWELPRAVPDVRAESGTAEFVPAPAAPVLAPPAASAKAPAERPNDRPSSVELELPLAVAPAEEIVRAPLEPEEDTQDLEAAQGASVALSIADAERRLLEPQDRDDIARTLLQFAASRFPRSILLVVRKREIAAWVWSGPNLSGPALAAYRAELDEPSIFQSLHAGSEGFRGVLPPVPAHQALLAAFDPEFRSAQFAALPVRVRGRLVAVALVEARVEDAGLEERIAELRRIAAKATIAFELCIMRGKLKSA